MHPREETYSTPEFSVSQAPTFKKHMQDVHKMLKVAGTATYASFECQYPRRNMSHRPLLKGGPFLGHALHGQAKVESPAFMTSKAMQLASSE